MREEPAAAPPARSSRRGSGARARGRSRAAGFVDRSPLRQPRSPYAPLDAVSADELEAIHHASLRILRDVGMNFLLPEAVELLAAAGADTEAGSSRVRFDPDLVLEKLAQVPAEHVLHGRNPARDVVIGGRHLAFGSVASAPHATDVAGGRRSGRMADFLDFIRLSQSFNIVHFISGYPVEPVDVDPRVRHLEALSALVRLCDKPFNGYALGRERMADAIEIARIARGIDRATLEREPSVFTVVNANSPLQYDRPMLEGAIEMARALQPVVYTPFTLSGAMAPASIAGALVQQNAEALAGICFSQCVRAGAPVVYGSFTSNVDMKTGAPAFGTPEYVKATLVSGQLARRYGLPLRASNANASNAADVQAAYESQMSIWACVLAHCNLMMHGFGWLEGGLSASFEKFVIDVEMLQMMLEVLTPLVVDEDSLAEAAIAEVGPGNHYFQSAHTLARYESAFYAPMLSDWRNYETWQESGSLDATQRAGNRCHEVLSTFEPPPLDAACEEALVAFVSRRREAGGAPPL